MPDAAVKAVISCAVVDGQVYVYLRDLDIPHYPVAADIQQILVILCGRFERLFREREIICNAGDQRSVICQRLFFCFLQFGVVHIADSLLISGLDYGLVFDCCEIAYDRVQADEQSNREKYNAKNHFLFSAHTRKREAGFNACLPDLYLFVSFFLSLNAKYMTTTATATRLSPTAGNIQLP